MLQFLFILLIILVLLLLLLSSLIFSLCIHVCVCADYYLLLDAENLDDTANGDASSFAIHAMVFFLGSMKLSCLRVQVVSKWLVLELVKV